MARIARAVLMSVLLPAALLWPSSIRVSEQRYSQVTAKEMPSQVLVMSLKSLYRAWLDLIHRVTIRSAVILVLWLVLCLLVPIGFFVLQHPLYWRDIGSGLGALTSALGAAAVAFAIWSYTNKKVMCSVVIVVAAILFKTGNGTGNYPVTSVSIYMQVTEEGVGLHSKTVLRSDAAHGVYCLPMHQIQDHFPMNCFNRRIKIHAQSGIDPKGLVITSDGIRINSRDLHLGARTSVIEVAYVCNYPDHSLGYTLYENVEFKQVNVSDACCEEDNLQVNAMICKSPEVCHRAIFDKFKNGPCKFES